MSVSLSVERDRLQRQVEQLEQSLSATHAELQLLSSDTEEESDDEVAEQEAEQSAAGLLALRDKVQKEIQNLETVLGTEGGSVWVSDDDSSSEEGELTLSVDSCLQLNLVYQQVVQETLDQLEMLLTQNHRQQKELMSQLSGPIKEPCREQPTSSSYQQPISLYLGRFLKPYFKDKLTGLGPPANQETKEKSSRMTGCLDNKKLKVKRWESWQKTLLIHSVSRDSLKRQIQPKLSRVDYLTQKLTSAKETDRQQLREQIDMLEKEIDLLKAKKEEELIGDRYEEHDWQKISNIDFEGTRDADDIRRFWQNFLHPSINKTQWSKEEVQQLKEISRRHEERHWETIAQELGTGRTAFMCLQTFQRFVSDSLRRRTWTPAEDVLLRELVDKMRIGNFIPYTQMSYFMDGRDPAQLIYRWNQVLDPGLKKGPWTKQEDQLLLEAVSRYGEKNWWKIRLEVPGRTDSACRDRYHDCLKAGTKRGAFDRREREQLLQLVEKHGVGHWAKIAAEIPHRNDAQCLRAWKIVSRLQPAQKDKAAKKPLRRRGGKKTSSAKKRIKKRIKNRLIKVEEEEEESTEDEEVVVEYMDSDEEKEKKERIKEPEELEEKEYTFPPMDEWIPVEKAENFTFLSFRPVVLPPSADAPSGKPARSTIVGKFGRSVIIGPTPRVLQWEMRHSSNTMMMVSPDQLRAYLHRRAQDFNHQTRVTDLGLDYELQAAVTPWIGNLLFPAKPRLTTADVLRGQGEKTQLSSTLIFQLLLQAMNVDTVGCRKMIEQRRNKVVFLTPPPNPSSVQNKNSQTVAGRLQQRSPMKEKLQHNHILKQLQELPPQDEQQQQQQLVRLQVQPQQLLLMQQPQPRPHDISLGSFPQKVLIHQASLQPRQPAVNTSLLSLHRPPAGRVVTSLSPAPSAPHRPSMAPTSSSQQATPVTQHLVDVLPHNGFILTSSASVPDASLSQLCQIPCSPKHPAKWKQVEADKEAASISQNGARTRAQLEASDSKAEARQKTLSCSGAQTQSVNLPFLPVVHPVAQQLRPVSTQSVDLPSISLQNPDREVSTAQNLSSAPPTYVPDHDYTFVNLYPTPDSRNQSSAPKQLPGQPSNYHLRQRKRGRVEEQQKVASGEADQSVAGTGTGVEGDGTGGIQKGKRIRKLSQKAKALQEATKAQAETKKKKTSSPCKKRPRKCHHKQAVQGPTQQVTQCPGLCLRPGQSMWVMTPGGLVQLAEGPPQHLQLALVPSGPFPPSPAISAKPPAPLASTRCRPVAPKPPIEPARVTLPIQNKSTVSPSETLLPTCVLQRVPYIVSSPIPSCPSEPSSVGVDPADPPSFRRYTMQPNPSLMFLEPHSEVSSWLSGQGGVVVPGAGMALPHLPPMVSSLDALSALLRTKKSLIKSSQQLLSQGSKPRGPQAKPKPDGNTEKTSSQPPPILPDSTSDLRPDGDPPALSISPDPGLEEESELVASVRQLVAERFSGNPAFQLLKARFLSCFTIPALMATIQPVPKKPLAPQDTQQEEEEDVEVVELKKIKERGGWRRSERSLLLCNGPGAPANHFSGIITPVPERTGPTEPAPPVQ